jgi:hypothetical protein
MTSVAARNALVVLVLLLPAAPAAGAGGGMPQRHELVDRVMATVGKDVVTLSDLERQARVLLVMRGGPQALSGLADPAFASGVLEYLVNQLLVLQEMRKQGSPSQGLREDAVAGEMRQFSGKFESPAAYRRFLAQADLTEESLRDLLLKGRRIEKFLAERSKSASEVTEDEAEEQYEKNKAAWQGKGMDDAIQEIRETLGRQRSEKFVREYLEDLRGRYEVRVLALPR